MAKFFSIILVTIVAFTAHASDSSDPKYFQLTKVKMTDVSAQYAAQSQNFAQAGLLESCDIASKPLVGVTSDQKIETDPLGMIEIVVDRIFNIGKKLWAILEAGRPVVNIKTYTANALPQGLTCWTDLTGWNVPKSKVYKVVYENAYGAEVVTFAYRVTFTAGGSLNGQGKYITNATIMPAEMDISWGFNLDAQAEVPSVFNTGTKDAPVAGMQMLMKWQVNSVMSHLEQAETFYVGGNNVLKHLQ